MKVLLSWLKDFVAIDVSIGELSDRLTMAGFEVTATERVEDDYILDIEVTPNRSDCFSVIGIARECALTLNKRFKPPRILFIPQKSAAYIKETRFEIFINNKDACPRYIGRVLLDVEIKESPLYIKERLQKLGLRCVNNIVDIINYVLFERGQPMHAFDYDKINGKKIVVRFAKPGEKIVTIDTQERTLDAADLVIADAENPIALAGIMGGIDTEVSLGTRNILLESAFFDPLTIRKSSQRHALTTESSYRFERSVDFPAVESASIYALDLMRQYASDATKKQPLRIDRHIDLIKKQIPLSSKVVLKYHDIEKALGIMPSSFWMRRLLRSLGCEIVAIDKEGFKLQAPSYRGDLQKSIDYVEEIARFYSYNNIPSKNLPAIALEQEKEIVKFGEKLYEDKIREALINLGLHEAITYALLSEDEVTKLDLKQALALDNPLTNNYSFLRPSILPSLLRVAQYNSNRNIANLAFFEMGKIYLLSEEGVPKEIKTAAILLSGEKYEDYFGNKLKFSFYDLKSYLQRVLEIVAIKSYELMQRKNYFFSASCSAVVEADSERIAIAGKASDEVMAYYDLKRDVYMAEVYWDLVKRDITKQELRYEEVGQYPLITRDISMLLPRNIAVALVLELLSGKDELITGVDIIDVYVGKEIPLDKKSVTVRIKFQSRERTLRDEEVDRIHKTLGEALLKKLPCQIR